MNDKTKFRLVENILLAVFISLLAFLVWYDLFADTNPYWIGII